MTLDWSKKQKRAIRELGQMAYRRELSAELEALGKVFRAWREGTVTCFDLEREIKTFSHGAAEELADIYGDPRQALAQVMRGLTHRVLTPEEVGPAIYERIAGILEPLVESSEMDQSGETRHEVGFTGEIVVGSPEGGRPIEIDVDELTSAMEDHHGEIAWFLDLRNGDVLPRTSEGFGDEDFDAHFEENEDDFIEVRPVDSHEGFRIMEDFAARVAPANIGKVLANALKMRKPFRSFKETLHAYPEQLAAFFAYKEGRLAAVAADWLKESGIHAKLLRKYRKPE